MLVERYEDEAAKGTLEGAADDLEARLRADARKVLRGFATEFPSDGKPELPPEVVEELLLTRVANENPAVGAAPRAGRRPSARRRPRRYARPSRRSRRRSPAARGSGPRARRCSSSCARPRATPRRRSSGQLRFIRRALARPARRRARRADRADRPRASASWPRRSARSTCAFGGGGGGGAATGRRARRSRGAERRARGVLSSDSAWMPRVVLIAKSTYVWLDQLSRPYGRDIRTLDAIPDEELDTLARWGVTGLWLIGLWERSRGVRADQALARQPRRGRVGLLARRLPDRRRPRRRGGLRRTCATGRGRAASGWRATWSPTTWASTRAGSSSTPSGSCRSPSRPTRPTRSAGADLSTDERVGIVLEDHYWDDSDAAVVVQALRPRDRRRRATSTTATTARASRGTTRPSSTSSTPAVREQVIQTILDVARRFPIIRFDAAMVLAKKHIQRLWWPEPGHRRRHPVARRARDARRRSSTRGCRSSSGARSSTGSPPRCPDTLLLAEAFWLLEGYFVRTLGMHRVYNSAFMHMLRDEDNAGYRQGHQGDARVRPRDPQALRQLHEQPRREDRASSSSARATSTSASRRVLATLPGPADARPRPGRGLRREVRHGVPAGDARRAARPVAGRAPRARDLPAAPPAGAVRRGAATSCCTTS